MEKIKTLSNSQRAALNTRKFKYQCKDDGSNWEWYDISNPDGLVRMYNRLYAAYIKPNDIVQAMKKGLEARTPFARFRAVPIDGEKS